MSRALFMAKLKEGLAGLPQPEIDEIVSDYEHHFAEAAATGQSENEIVAGLGDPVRLAQELRSDVDQSSSAGEEFTSPPPTPPPVTPTSGARIGGGVGLLLALLVMLGLAAAAYYVIGRNHGGGVPTPVASAMFSAPPQPPAPPAPPHQTMAAPSAHIVISGGQSLDLGTITQERIEIVVDGSGRVTGNGQVTELILRIDGNGSADFGALQAKIVHVDLSGTGSAEVSPSQLGDITISGSGVVRLRVKPRTLKQSVTGSGQIISPS